VGRYSALPGGALVERGLDDLANGAVTVESLLVSTASTRLAALGVRLPQRLENPEDTLWALLVERHGDAAHSRLNSLRRELVSFQHSCAKEVRA
jgi:hypothetical protein